MSSIFKLRGHCLTSSVRSIFIKKNTIIFFSDPVAVRIRVTEKPRLYYFVRPIVVFHLQ